jgi:diguanylate cyclase (GGDEF)-like protein
VREDGSGRPAPALRRLARQLAERPPTATPSRSAAQVQVLCAVGAVLGLAISSLPRQDTALVAVLEASALTAAGVALVVRARGALHRVALHAVLLLASLAVTAASSVATDPLASTALAAAYPVLLVVAMSSLSRIGVLGHLCLAVAGVWLVHGWGGAGTTTTLVTLVAALLLLVLFLDRTLRAAVRTDVDALTHLPNRRAFEHRMSGLLAQANATANSGEQAPTVSVLLLDLDHFETLNRERGQHAGDDVLRAVARRLSAALPAGAAVARLEGDQFGVLLQGPAHGGALLEAAEGLRRATAPVPCSVGAAQAEAEQDAPALLRRAEVALHSAKSDGRACVRVAEPRDEQLLGGLRRALAAHRVQVALQPLVDPSSGDLVGVEALARWEHPTRGWVPPGVFVPLAEKNGLVGELGRVVLERACQDARALVDHVGHPVTLTVNASGAELVRPEYADQVAAVLHRTGWPARDLVVEVTESSLDAASPATLATVGELRGLGVRIAIDDFGTGYSAFSQLDQIPAEFLKLDTSFTAATTVSPRRRAMLAALVGLCRDLGIKVIAEGVETAEQADLVRRFGCDLAQGYYFSRPVPVASLVGALPGAGAPAPAAADPVPGAR